MRYKLLGQSGLRVSELCLGTMTFDAEAWGSDPATSRAIYDRFRDAGGNFLDTANEIYAGGRSEETIAELVRGHRDEVVIGTKYTNAIDAADANFAGNHRKSMRRSLERSLTRLKTDHVDLFWIHAWDFTVAPDEVMRSLDDMVREGKVLHIGISNTPAWLIARSNTLAELRGWTRFAAVQVEYNLAERSAELETLPMARSLGLSALAWSPLAMGVLTGKYLGAPTDNRRLDVVKFREAGGAAELAARRVSQIAEARNASAAAVALAWLRAQPGVIPVFGARTLEQLEACLASTGLVLGVDDLAMLGAACEPPTIVPYNAIKGGRSIIYGGHADKIDF